MSMNKRTDKATDEQAMLDRISMQLDDSVETLDARTLSRLNVARHRALETRASSRRHSWMLPTVFASLFVVLSASWLLNTQQVSPTDDQFIASSEDIELIDDLEFVSWLAEQDAS